MRCQLQSMNYRKIKMLITDKMGKTIQRMYGTKTYNTWKNMKTRCNNTNDPRYSSYGGRGITVCDRWNTFKNFYEDMGDKPDKMSLDRIDNDGNYKLKNCRWASSKDQAANRRDTLYITYDGKKMTIIEASEMYSIKYATLRDRINKGWNSKKAIERML